MQYCYLKHQLLLSPQDTLTARYCFCFGSASLFLLELFLHSSPVAYWASTDVGSSSFSVKSFCLFILSKITADGDCSHEIKRSFLLGRKVMTNLDSILESRDKILSTKVHLVKGMVFPVVRFFQQSCMDVTAVHGVAKSQTRLSVFTFTFHFHALEKEMATHSSVLAWRIPGMGEPHRLLSMGSHRVGHD